ncbi:glycoside hydrolase family 16 protein [Mycolicibacterium tokaiense]|uniref:Glycoside hydrolase family protein n=1 Tax=Mycolicibacterium tokaiense TaxID=39695 RepID=A0A378TFT4_9MYCO|nr:glycoside hydrolase family 16 protein [Mycolicibacterium tokaiense]BBY86486.1 hydrolase [Mycolicibacterium tokaiense]STZ59007.1 glycoside hydrolase family protein [Mycolicibacterium tokaiense]
MKFPNRNIRAVVVTGLAVALLAFGTGSSSGEPVDLHADASLSALIDVHALYAHDDFDGPVNSPLDPAMWHIETGGVGWGGSEAQAYTAAPDNVRLDGSGNLVIEAREDNGHITSARVNTQDLVELTTGLVAARIQMPAGQGLHPAFWMLGRSIRDVGWPASGEIDIVELLNEGSTAYFTVLGPPVPAGPGPGTHSQAQFTLRSTDLVNSFHTYWLYKQPEMLVFGIDETPVATVTPAELASGAPWIYDTPFFAVLNLAVGGTWPGPVGAGVLPARMTVDWVRFYR